METQLPTIDIHGQSYVLVKDRILRFHELYPKGSITTEIISSDTKSVVIKATVKPDEVRIFTGYSEAHRSGPMGMVAVEIAETSAVGRALAMLGIGIIESVASADEMNKASQGFHDAPGSTKTYKADNTATKPKSFNLEAMKGKPVTPGQVSILTKNGFTRVQAEKFDRYEASVEIDKIFKAPVVSDTDINSELDAIAYDEQDQIVE